MTLDEGPSAEVPADEEPTDVEPADELPEDPTGFDSPSRGAAPRNLLRGVARRRADVLRGVGGAFSDRVSGSAATETTAALWKPAGDNRAPVDGDVCATETLASPSCSVIEQP